MERTRKSGSKEGRPAHTRAGRRRERNKHMHCLPHRTHVDGERIFSYGTGKVFACVRSHVLVAGLASVHLVRRVQASAHTCGEVRCVSGRGGEGHHGYEARSCGMYRMGQPRQCQPQTTSFPECSTYRRALTTEGRGNAQTRGGSSFFSKEHHPTGGYAENSCYTAEKVMGGGGEKTVPREQSNLQ